MDEGWSWVVLVATFTAQLLHAGVMNNVGLYMVEWQKHFDVGAAAVASLVTEQATGLLISALVSGSLCRRFGCRRVMMLGGTINISATFIASFASKLWHLHIFCFVSGIGCGICYVASLVVVRFFFEKRLGLANGVTSAGVGAGIFLMVPLVERLCSEYGWKGALMIHAAINGHYLVSGMSMRSTKMERLIIRTYNSKPTLQPNEQRVSRGLRGLTFYVPCLIARKLDEAFALSRLVRIPVYIALVFVAILTFNGHVAVVIFTIPRLVSDLGFSTKSASLVMLILGICSLLARAFHGVLLDLKVIGSTNLLLLSLIIAGTSIFIPMVTSLTGQILMLAVFGTDSGVLYAVMVLVCREHVPIDIASNAIGLMMALGYIGIITGSQIMGILNDATGSYDVPFYISGVGFWVSLFLMVLVTKCPCFRQDRQQGQDTSTQNSRFSRKDSVEDGSVGKICNENIDRGYRRVPKGDDFNVTEEETRV